MRLVVCSNSGPAQPREAGAPLQAGAAGGLVPVLLSLLDRVGGEWVFPAPESSARPWPQPAQGVVLNPLPIPEEQRRLHYEVISIETLLWLFHYLHDTVSSPAFDARLHRAWAAYREVNELVAGRLARAVGQGDGGTVVLVNDYHYLLVPGLLARAGAAAGARVVYAHQVPWCGPDYFGLLPGPVREQILTSLLSCHTVVFHSWRWAEAFAGCCDRYLPAAEVAGGAIRFRDRRTRLLAAPLPLDVGAVQGLQDAEPTRRWRRRLSELAAGRRLLVRVDRLDLWKNHLRGFAAYEALLRRRPGLAGEVLMVAVAAPTRYRSPRHVAYEAACRTSVDRINRLAGGPGRPEPVALLYPTGAGDLRHRGIAALGQASAVLVNPTYDGLNMVAKEAMVASDTAAVLLSRNAGAYDQLAPAVAPLDPFDVEGTADAIEAALAEGAPADPAAAARVRELVRGEDAAGWLRAVVPDGR
jgi:trehalose 6-phosphate synthase